MAFKGLMHPFPLAPTHVEGEQLSPEPLLVKVSTQHRANSSGEPEGTQHREQVKKGPIPRVPEPGLDGDGIVWMTRPKPLGSYPGLQCWRGHSGPQRGP